MADNESAAGLGKGYLIALIVAVVVMLVSPGGRSMLFGRFTRRRPAPAAVHTARRVAPADSTQREGAQSVRADLDAFGQWFLDDDLAPVALIKIEGVGRVDGASLVDAAQERGIWPVRVNGTFAASGDAAGRFYANVGGRILRPGDRIEPAFRRAGYHVLSISRRCVWFMVFSEEEAQLASPPVALPDLAGIRLSSTGDLEALQVELRPGQFAATGDAFTLTQTGGQVVIGKLWHNAAHFRYQPSGGEEAMHLLCVVLPN